jgi:hypothetical protein
MFQLASVTRNSQICSQLLVVIYLYHETPLDGRLHTLVGSCLPLCLGRANYWLFTYTASVVSR